MYILDTRGFVSRNNNCFLNCLIMAMFFYKKSPFYDIKKFPNNRSRIIHKCIIDVMEHVKRDGYPDLTFFRKVLPSYMQHGQQDATETFDNIMKLLNYEPIKTCVFRENKDSNGKVVQGKKIIQNNSYIFLNNNGEENIKPIQELFYPTKWEDLGIDQRNWAHNDKDKPMYRYTRTRFKEMLGKTLIFVVNRSAGQNRRHTNRVETPLVIQSNGVDFVRHGVILHLGGSIHFGHYILVLYDKEEYYVYNDMNGSKIKDNPINYKKVRELIERNSIMYFYYS